MDLPHPRGRLPRLSLGRHLYRSDSDQRDVVEYACSGDGLLCALLHDQDRRPQPCTLDRLPRLSLSQRTTSESACSSHQRLGKGFESIYYLSIGTDQSESKHLATLRRLITETWPEGEMCDFYSTPDATGKTSKIYANTVLRIESPITATELSTVAKSLEARMGRTKGSTDVPLDIDIVVQDGNILRPKDYGQEYFRRGYELLRKG
ncbi:2-amino-4-hydroxy-6-hydroxymethyldihydropteridine diphosphokinase [Porphyromonas cangingivalis]|uniref:2-amino-4-hydroxy-6- hydroxymethyldihydropteridine diphosphokinase n=1 Tax=Porphyromonas cangingivalis TaxID=36874 RepID=UPI001F231793|nr:2-amino-4-hydroxy-6-hydroxymethyldihydropteridine diphosphokinase [Porphyromonas cangingivalis]